MPTIKTYFKGAPFYIASSYRNVGVARFPVSDNACFSGAILRDRLSGP